MHNYTLEKWQHTHDFTAIDTKSENRTHIVLFITFITMIIEIIAGSYYGSMALLADGWHMGTHVAAFAITILAYRYARKNMNNQKFTFGPGKVNVLGGFASAIALAVVALIMAIESIGRLYNPEVIQFNEAILVAVIGLIINLISALLLKNNHSCGDRNHHHDHNLRAAYIHVIADALTSILAIVALFAGKYIGLNWLDALMGVIGAVIISRWAYGLIIDTSSILLDKNIDVEQKFKIKEQIESDSDNRISDLHLWKVGSNDYATIISLVTHFPKAVEHYKKLLNGIDNLSHITIEINQCTEKPCILPKTKN